MPLAEARPFTGRTRPVRVHAAHLGAPVAGDDKRADAGASAMLRAAGLKQLFLHASSLRFAPRERGAPIAAVAPLPEALPAVLTAVDLTLPASWEEAHQ